MKSYMVKGDLTSEKSSDAYPIMTLCDECVTEYTIITEQGSGDEFCESCGCRSEEFNEDDEFEDDGDIEQESNENDD